MPQLQILRIHWDDFQIKPASSEVFLIVKRQSTLIFCRIFLERFPRFEMMKDVQNEHDIQHLSHYIQASTGIICSCRFSLTTS